MVVSIVFTRNNKSRELLDKKKSNDQKAIYDVFLFLPCSIRLSSCTFPGASVISGAAIARCRVCDI